MTSQPDVQNVPDVWTLLQSALSSIGEHTGKRVFADKEDAELLRQIDAALAQRDRFVLVPKLPTTVMLQAGYDAYKREYVDGGNSDDVWSRTWDALLAAAPKPDGKP